jgi:long-chain acyl-CoA synthetase
MRLNYLQNIIKANYEEEAIVWKNKIYTYQMLEKEIEIVKNELNNKKILSGTVVELYADFSPKAIAFLLALIELDCIIVPTTKSIKEKRKEFLEIAEVEVSIDCANNDIPSYHFTQREVKHPLLKGLKNKHHSGLILFSSGSTGKPKAAVHDFVPLLEKFETPRAKKRIINFLLFDHIGGINTLFHTLFNSGCVITLEHRTPEKVCEAIQKYHAEILPTSPTFINLLLLSKAYKNYDLSSLELITYGTEVMPESTLKSFNAIFPSIKLSQTYGLSELGILRAKSKSSDSLYMKIGGEGYETRIVDRKLEIKAKSAMLGYLNAESPFTSDGWFKTNDVVEVEGEYLRILGRASEIINVGGEKVYPAEVESIIQMMDGVLDVAVCGEANPITGHIVKATVKLDTDENSKDFRIRMREFCKTKLASFKIPQKILIAEQFSHNERFKRIRQTVRGENHECNNNVSC